MTPINIDRVCKALTKNGKPCRAAATTSGLCFFHGNPDKASELGRIGGRKNRRTASQDASTPATFNTATAVRDLLARLIQDVYSGKIPPKVASSLAPLLNLQLRMIETSELEGRLANVEMLLPTFAQLERGRPSMDPPQLPRPILRMNL